MRPSFRTIAVAVGGAALAAGVAATALATTPGEVLEDRCRMECRAEATPADVCAARCTCVAQGFQLGLAPEELPRWIADLDGTGARADAARKRWDETRKACESRGRSGY